MKYPTQRECDAFYGNPRNGAVVDPKWYASNIILIDAPWKMAMGSINITRIPFHRKAADGLRLAFTIIKDTMLDSEITAAGLRVFSGSYNYRAMRGGEALSMHAYGIAIDFDAPRNALGNRHPEMAKHPKVIKAFQEAGAIWGGDWDGDGDTIDERRCDGMHFQFARLG